MKMSRQGDEPGLDSFEIIRKDQGFVLGKSPEKTRLFQDNGI